MIRFFLVAITALLWSGISKAEVQLTLREGSPLYSLGRGVNSATSELMSGCLENPAGKQFLGNFAQTTHVKIIESTRDLLSMLNTGAYAAYFGPLSKVTADLKSTTSTNTSSKRTSFYVKVSITGVWQEIVNEKPSADAVQAMNVSYEEFTRSCGDTFVSQVVSGAELLILVTHDISSAENDAYLRMGLAASFGRGAVAVDADKKLKTIARDSNVEVRVTQIGLGGMAPPPFNDFEKLVDYGRTFAANVFEALKNDPGVVAPYRIHLQPYARSIAFRLAIGEAQRRQLLDFDPSIKILETLVETYDIGFERLRLANKALNKPELFKAFDRAALERWLPELTSATTGVRNQIDACVAHVRSGRQCDELRITGKAIPQFPKGAELELLEICQLTQSARDRGCTEVNSVNGICRCMACEFEKTQRYAQIGTAMGGVCRNLPPSRTAEISIAGKMDHDGDYRKLGFRFKLNDRIVGNVQEGAKFTPFSVRESAMVDPKGEISADLRLETCGADTAPQFRTCILLPSEPDKAIIGIKVVD